ncbi:hypothetical protein [Francisella tularensis]
MLIGEDDFRISGAGAQDKMMIAFVDNQVAIPLHNTPLILLNQQLMS